MSRIEEDLMSREEIENNDDFTKKLVHMKGNQILTEYPRYRSYLKRKFLENNDDYDKINEYITGMDFFEFIDEIKNLNLEKEKMNKIVDQSLFYISQVFDENFNEEDIKNREDTIKIFDYEIKSEKLKRFFEFLSEMSNNEKVNNNPIMKNMMIKMNNNTSSFKLYYQMKKTFIFMKELKDTEEDEYLEYLNSKIGFSIENLLKIKDFIVSPNSTNLKKDDKNDILGFYSTFGIISKNFKTSKNYQNHVFQQIEENNRKNKIMQRLNRKMEERKKINLNENLNTTSTVSTDILSEIDEELNKLSLLNQTNDNLDNSDNSNNSDEEVLSFELENNKKVGFEGSPSKKNKKKKSKNKRNKRR
jgi:hypothetical protein